jgi:hypothetical protein
MAKKRKTTKKKAVKKKAAKKINLKNYLKTKNLRLPHGYALVKRKPKKRAKKRSAST